MKLQFLSKKKHTHNTNRQNKKKMLSNKIHTHNKNWQKKNANILTWRIYREISGIKHVWYV